jgi:methyltransferase (TIGR00027 family)
MRPTGQLRGVTKTALGVAVMRAVESRRDDRLFDDPYAQAFADALPGAFPEAEAAAGPAVPEGLASLGAAFYASAVIRTRFFDDFLLTASASCRQVVLLAAGLDARAFRLPWPPGTRMFELDLPEVFPVKEAVLARRGAVPRCERITVPADLRSGWREALIQAGFDRGAPAAWLAEGVLLYLAADEASRLLTGVGDLAVPGSLLAFDHAAQDAGSLVSQARALPAMRPYTGLWKGGLGGDAGRWLEGRGWRPQFHGTAAIASRYRRTIPAMAGGGFLTAVRLDTEPAASPGA